MRMKKVLSLVLSGTLALSLTACSTNAAKTAEGATEENTSKTSADAGNLKYSDITLGETGTDISTTIKMLTNRTDMMQDDYTGKTYPQYVADFNKMYPDIKVDIEPVTDYAEDSILRLQGGDWGDIMLIPAIDAAELSTYFIPYGTVDEMKKYVRFATDKQYGGICYGVPTTGDAQGVLYNKKVFEEAGITELPKTPDEFIADLKLIKEKTKAIPLYTNYAAGWTMGAWDAYIAGSATGDSKYMNQELIHAKDPFADPGDGTHAYNVYKILYDAVAQGLTEDDYTTTDWEGSKGMMNRGEIGTMVLGSWAFAQMQAAGENKDDIGYMTFPITVNGKQYASAGANYSFGINASASDENKLASMIFVKWMTEKSGFAYNEGGMPIALDDDNWPEVYSAFDKANVEYVPDEPALEGEEDILSVLNADSELNINNGGDKKVQSIIEHASIGDKTYDEIISEWNTSWTDAQETNGVEVK